MKKGVFNGLKYRVYSGGLVNYGNGFEAGYLDKSDILYIEENNYSGINLDLYVENKLHIPLFIKNKKCMEKVNEKKYPKTFQANILKEAIGAIKFNSVVEKYLQKRRERLLGINKTDKALEMYRDYKKFKMSFEQISVKYNIKQIGKVKNIITEFALKEARGCNILKYIAIVSSEDFTKYGHYIQDDAIRKIVEKSIVEGIEMKTIAKEMNITFQYGYYLKSKGVKIMLDKKNSFES